MASLVGLIGRRSFGRYPVVYRTTENLGATGQATGTHDWDEGTVNTIQTLRKDTRARQLFSLLFLSLSGYLYFRHIQPFDGETEEETIQRNAERATLKPASSQ